MKTNGSWRPQRVLRLTLLGVLLPLTVASTAQTQPQAIDTSTAIAPLQLQPNVNLFSGRIGVTANTAAATPTANDPHPLPADFDVAEFERMARAMTVGRRVPGVALAIVHDGQVLTEKGYGVTSVNAPQAIDAHTVFRLASLSKSFAATLTGLLVDDGTLGWNSRIADYVPDFHLSSEAATQQLTIADVLSQRSGLLAHNAFDHDIEAGASYQSVADRLAYARLGCMPGDCYSYQNVAFSLAGDAISKATGNDYAQLVRTRIFQPLGMNDASLGIDGLESSARWARPHARSRNGWVAETVKPNYYRLLPAAGVNCSISDLAQYLIAHTGHRPDVLPPQLLDVLHTQLVQTMSETRTGWRRERVDDAGYALGWRVFDYSGHRVILHAGAVEGYRGWVAMIPERDLGVAILWNSSSWLPSGLLPTILDRAIGLPSHPWLNVPDADERLLATEAADDDADDAQPAGDDKAGSAGSSNTANAAPH